MQRSFDDVSGRIVLEWKPATSLLLFGSLSKAFKSGGVFGGFGLSPQAFVPYEPENIYAAEVGGKWTRSDTRLRFESSAFYYDYRDLQGQVLVTAATGSLPQLTNVGDARILGVEATLHWLPAEHLEMTAGLGRLDTKLRDSITTLDSLQRPLNLAGRELPHAPSTSANVVLRYEWPLPSARVLNASVDAGYRAGYEGDLPNQAHFRQDGSTLLVGGRLALQGADRRWQLALWGRNMSDERYLVHSNSSGIGNDILMYGEPRSYGVQISHRWQ